MKLRYNPRRGWFGIFEVRTGTVIFGTDIVVPDEYGCFSRRFILGPFLTAKEAIRAW